MEIKELRGYLTLWPEVVTQKDLVTRVIAILSPSYCEEACPDTKGYFEHKSYIPTLRSVVAQLMKIEGEILDNIVWNAAHKEGEFKASLGLDIIEKVNNLSAFVEAYVAMAYNIMTADEEMYRRKGGISIEEVKEGGTELLLLNTALSTGHSAAIERYADLLEQDSRGILLVDFISKDRITKKASAIEAKKSLFALIEEQVTPEVAGDVGILYAHSRYRKLLPFIGDSLELPSEYEKAK